MKVFIGIKISEPKQLSEIKSEYNTKISGGIKWVKEDNLHLTLVFIGIINTNEIEYIKDVLRKLTQKHQPFNIYINGIDIFQKKRKNSILWLKVKASNPLLILQREVFQSLKIVLPNLKSEYDAYTPHITIARYKHNLNIQKQLHKILTTEIRSLQKLTEIQLLESCSTIKGIEYKVIDWFELA